MSNVTRRGLLGAAAATGALVLARPALAAWPEQPIRIVVPWNAGGLADLLIRIMAAPMSAQLGQPVVIENRPGANGAVGTQAVARSPADGYTLILANAETHAINPLIYPKLAYNPARDFVPVSLFARGPFALITRPGFGANTFQEWLAKVKAAPGKVTFASWGIGSTPHLAMEGLCAKAGLEMLHVPFTGAAPASTAIIAGQVDCMFLNAGPAEAAARDGRPKLLALGGSERLALLPNVPSMTEVGVPLEAANWFGLLGPAGMPAPAAQRIAAVVAEVLKAPAIQDAFRTQAAVPVPTPLTEFGAFIAEDAARWAPVVKALDIRLD